MINVGNAFGKNANTGNKNISWWKRFTKGYSMLINLRKLIHPAKINMIFIKIWKLKTNFGTWSAPVSLTRAVPWNSMEIHGTWGVPISMTRAVSWNYMQIHGTWSVPISLTRAVAFNSMELGVRQFRWHGQFHGIPWNLGCAHFDDTSSSMEFRGNPWNLECANFADTSSCIQFHGTWSAPMSMTRVIPWQLLSSNV